MGFDLNVDSPTFSSPLQLNALREWISGPRIIGEFSGMQEKADIDELLKTLDLDIIQLGPFAQRDWVFDVLVYREVLINNLADLPDSDAYIIKGDGKSLSDPDNVEKLKELCKDRKVFIDISLSPEELVNLDKEIQPEGFVLRGGEEEKVGYKSFDELDEIMEALEVD